MEAQLLMSAFENQIQRLKERLKAIQILFTLWIKLKHLHLHFSGTQMSGENTTGCWLSVRFPEPSDLGSLTRLSWCLEEIV